jgi:DNA-binding HxlR family transcriptional regulator
VRAGDLGLRLLSAPANVRALKALEAGLTSPGIRAELVELGLVESPTGSGEYELTRSGVDLILVGRILARWLAMSPHGAVQLGRKPAQGAIRALLGGWTPGIVRALAARPLSSAELQQLLPRPRRASLEEYLLALERERLAEMVRQRDGVNRLAATDWLRYAAWPLAASARWERLHLSAESAPIAVADVESAFLLLIPMTKLSRPVSGTCRLAVELPGVVGETEAAGVVVSVRDGSIASFTSRLSDEVSARAEGSARAWLRAGMEGKLDRLRIAGDRGLVDVLLAALARLSVAREAPSRNA